ncbi:MAG: hypothetical protein ACERLG_09015 [Sedimentibacter sp.]
MLLKSKEIAYLGVLLGLNQLFIVLSSVIETNTVALFAAASGIVGIVIVELGVKSGVAFYLASCVLGFFLTFNKVEIIIYIIFFGLYSIVKHVIEIKLFSKKTQFLAKFIFFNLSLAAMYFAVRLFITLKLFWWMVAGVQLLFVVYDLAFTKFIDYYINTIKPKLK